MCKSTQENWWGCCIIKENIDSYLITELSVLTPDYECIAINCLQILVLLYCPRVGNRCTFLEFVGSVLQYASTLYLQMILVGGHKLLTHKKYTADGIPNSYPVFYMLQ